jgi:hypothetical protein
VPDHYTVYFVTPFGEHFAAVRTVVAEACVRAQSFLAQPVRMISPDAEVAAAYSNFDIIRTADLVIADVSRLDPRVMLEIGVRIGTDQQFLLMSDDVSPVPSELGTVRRLVYDRILSSRGLVAMLGDVIAASLVAGDTATGKTAKAHVPTKTQHPSVFVSYSHGDREYLDRLRVHLKPLERLGMIELWDDTRIKSGEKWRDAITSALSRAAVAILLISADFLASDFIVDNELPPLLKAAEERGTVVLPLVLTPCRFVRDLNLAAFQAINDPRRPLIALPGAEREAVYARLAERVEALFGTTSV